MISNILKLMKKVISYNLPRFIIEKNIYLSSSSPFSKLARVWELGLLSISLAKRAAFASSFLQTKKN